MAPKNNPIEAPNIKYTAKLPGTNIYKEQIIITSKAGIKNLYFERKPTVLF
jgi:hypothetical protein